MKVTWQEVVELAKKSNDLQINYWLNQTLFSFSWWVILSVTLIALILWLIIVDKKRVFEIITYGVMVEIIAVVSDNMGVLFMIWRYKHTLTPLPTTAEIHTLLMPIIYMIIYQYFNTWRTFLIAITINAFVFAFILEPLLIKLDIYELIHWKHIYSFLPYILIAVACKYIMTKLKQNDK